MKRDSQSRNRAPRKPGRDPERSSSELTLRLPYRPPYDWDGVLNYLAARATPGVESVSDNTYRRSLRLADTIGTVEVRVAPDESALVASLELSSTASLRPVRERLRRLFDLDADPQAIRAHLENDRRLCKLIRHTKPARVPGTWDGFELSVRAILGQQVSVKGATTLTARVVKRFGEPLRHAREGLSHLFPTPAALAEADLTNVGVTKARTRSVNALSAAIAADDLDLDGLQGLDESVRRLRKLPGIGEWTAQYIAMRALREADAFPAGDLGLRRALGGGQGPVSERELRNSAERWRPWRAYAAIHLWMSEAARQEGKGRRRRFDSRAGA